MLMSKIRNSITEVKNFPKAGINFKDITSLMLDGEAYKYTIDQILEFAQELEVDLIAGPEARGFITGCPVAYLLGVGFIPVRKPGKLPRPVLSEEYDLEYGTNTLCIHKGDIKPGSKVLIIDDILATGGTMEATIKLIEKAGGIVVGLAFIIELIELMGREKINRIKEYPIKTLEKY